MPFFEFRTFISKARAFCLYPLPSLPCQPRAGCTGEPVAARGLVSGRGPRRQAWEGWSEAEGLPCKRPGGSPSRVHRAVDLHLGYANLKCAPFVGLVNN